MSAPAHEHKRQGKGRKHFAHCKKLSVCAPEANSGAVAGWSTFASSIQTLTHRVSRCSRCHLSPLLLTGRAFTTFILAVIITNHTPTSLSKQDPAVLQHRHQLTDSVHDCTTFAREPIDYSIHQHPIPNNMDVASHCARSSLTPSERYSLFCDHLRAQLSYTAARGYAETPTDAWRSSIYDRRVCTHDVDDGETNDAVSFGTWSQRASQRVDSEDVTEAPTDGAGAFPACFYARMMRTRAGASASTAPPTPRPSAPSDVDEQRLAERLASQIRQSTREHAAQARAAARAAPDSGLYNGVMIAPYADARLEHQLSQLHDETTDLLLHVRRENRQSAELRERLTHTKLLLQRVDSLDDRDVRHL